VNELRKLGFTIMEEHVHSGLENTKQLTGLKGRWDIRSVHPAIIYDVAHNMDGISQVLHQLDIYYPGAALHFVLGFVKDKDVDSVLELFPKNANYYFCNAHIPRALPHNELQEKAGKMGLEGESYDRVTDAIDAAKSKAERSDVIMVCGSFFTIAEAP